MYEMTEQDGVIWVGHIEVANLLLGNGRVVTTDRIAKTKACHAKADDSNKVFDGSHKQCPPQRTNRLPLWQHL